MTIPWKSSRGRVRLKSNLSCSQDNHKNLVHLAFPTFIKRPVRVEPAVNGKERRSTDTPCTSDKWLEFLSGRREIKFQGISMFKKMWKKCLDVKRNFLSQNQARQKYYFGLQVMKLYSRGAWERMGESGWSGLYPPLARLQYFNFLEFRLANASIWNILEEFERCMLITRVTVEIRDGSCWLELKKNEEAWWDK